MDRISYNSPKNNFDVLVFGNVSGRVWDDFRGIVGRFVGRFWGHVSEVFWAGGERCLDSFRDGC